MNETVSDHQRDWAETAEQRMLDAALPLVKDCGWTNRLVTRAAEACGLSPGDAQLLLPNGPRDLAALLSRRCDARALQALEGPEFDGLKVREKIARAVEARLDAAVEDEAAARRLCGYLALPQNMGLGLQLAWESADKLWRRAGDVSTDENHYSKRAILAGILVSALAMRIQHGREAAEAFTARRIENVMSFEKLKARVKSPLSAETIAAALARARYGSHAAAPATEGEAAPPPLAGEGDDAHGHTV
jgi:ubiquinone biosynthesis protein COQ9